jgi:hypothetical protein
VNNYWIDGLYSVSVDQIVLPNFMSSTMYMLQHMLSGGRNEEL